MNYILGISAYYHDSAAVLIKDGEIVAAANEERFTRLKHDSSFPENAVKFVLEQAVISLEQVSLVAFYDKPFMKFERLLETYLAFAPRGFATFLKAMPVWIKEKIFTKHLLRKALGKYQGKILFPEHHLSHAASAFYPSPYKNAAILTIDGVGEWATMTISKGEGNNITILKELNFPHSIGLLYSAFTYYAGFRVNSGEYKLMGLAPYGDANSEETKRFIDIIKEEIVDIRNDGSILLNMKNFQFATGMKMTHNRKWEKLFGFSRRNEEDSLTQTHMNFSLAAQQVTEEIVLKLSKTACKLTGFDNLVMAGGVALNSVANGKILADKVFANIWIQPAAGDAGGALGAAMAAHHIYLKNDRVTNDDDSMKGSLLGPAYADKYLESMIEKYDLPFSHYHDFIELADKTASYLANGKVVGWFQGRMEFGPRALGCRSILGDARDPMMQKKMNLKIKQREGFRPFAPSVLEEDIKDYFELDCKSPYMLLVVPVRKEKRKDLPAKYNELDLYQRLYHPRSEIPAVTHLDFSARLQSVSGKYNPRYHQLIRSFKEKTGVGVIINTSFNVRGEPIVCTPEDAFRCFMNTEMDYLVIGDFLFNKSDMGLVKDRFDWNQKFKLD